jgi:hypothetical protein
MTKDWSTEPEGGYIVSPPAAVCPECRDGKHGNCIGYALDQATDTVVACGCGHTG